MLDASVLMMQQYCAAATVSNTLPPGVQRADRGDRGEQSNNPHTTSTEHSVPSTGENGPITNSSPQPEPPSQTQTQPEPVPSTSSSSALGENDELRRRRLQHFEQQRQ